MTEDDAMTKIEDSWFQDSSDCSDTSTSLTSNSLGMESFWGLFLIVGVAAALAFIIYLVLFLHEHQNIITNSQLSVSQKIQQLMQNFNSKDLRSHTFRSIEVQVQTNRDGDGSKSMMVLSPHSDNAGIPFSLPLQVPQTPRSSTATQDQLEPSREDFSSDQLDTSIGPSPNQAHD